MDKQKLFYFTLIFICLFLFFWLIGISSLVFFRDFPIINNLLPLSKITFSKFCHQNINKTIILNGAPFLVCSRCLGIYSGSFIFSILMIIFYKKNITLKLKWLIIALLFIIADIIFYNLNFYNYSKTIAFVTGFFLGSIFISYINSQIKNYFVQ